MFYPITDFEIKNNFINIKNQFTKVTNEQFTNTYESKITRFYDELLKISNNLGLGSDILVETVYEGQLAEKVFTIKPHHKINRKDKHYLLNQIVEYMADFSKRNNLFDFYKDAYVLIE